MAYDEGLAAQMADDLGPQPGLERKKMFGGLCHMINGHMVCGVHKGGAMYRVGPDRYDTALALPGVKPLSFTGRPMKGLVEISDEVMGDDDVRHALTTMALAFNQSLPPK